MECGDTCPLRGPKSYFPLVPYRKVTVGNQHKWDSLGPKSSGGRRVFGELSEGCVVSSSALDRPGLHLLSAL